MDVDFALSRLEGLKRGDALLSAAGGRDMPLHSMVTCCGWQLRERGSRYDWHGLKRGKAEFGLIQYTLRGWGMLEYEGVRRKVGPGSVMLLHFPHNNRYWLPSESDGWEFIYACANGRDLMRIWRQVSASIGPIFELSSSERALDVLLTTYEEAVKRRLESPFENSAMAYALAMSLAKLQASNGKSESSRPEPVKRALRLCLAELQSPALDVDAMAAASGLSRHHFSRIFKQAMGESPAAYLKSLRMKEAAKLLQTRPMSVKEIAAACGFGDFSYFCHAFKQCYGIAPVGFKNSGMFGMRQR